MFDWSVPEEWNIREAYVAAPDGSRVIDFRDSSLHVVSYSEPVNAPCRSTSCGSGCSRCPTSPT